MLEALPKATFSMLANSVVLKKVASRYGMRGEGGFARRFIAGETLLEVIDTARRIERATMMVTLDHLGERVTSRDAATAATRCYMDIIETVADTTTSRNISVKLTQLGLDIDLATCVDNLRRVQDVAERAGFFVRIDMENSPYTAQTLDVFETMWSIGCRNLGVAIQSYLKRSRDDIKRMNELGARVRLVKGAYREPKDVAFQLKEEVDRAYLELMQMLLADGTYPAIATHDPVMIDAARAFATAHGIARDRFEFQLLYGIRRDLQRQLSQDGHPLRVYLPFGKEWFPYFMRRLGERPANIGFVFRNIAREEGET